MSSYQNRLQAYSGSIGENNNRLDNYLAKKEGVVATNKNLVNEAKSQLQQHLTGEFIKGAGFEGAIRAGKPMLEKGLSWVDKKTGLSNKVDDVVNKRLGTRFGQKSRVGETSEAPKRSAIEAGDEDAPSVRTIDTQPGSGRSRMIDDYENPDSIPGETKMSAPVDSESSFSRPSVRSNQIQPVDDMPESKVSVRSNQVQPTDSTQETKTSEGETKTSEGADETTADLGEGTESTIAEGAETATAEGAEQATAGGLEGAGALLDSTGVGAIVGVPLQIAGLALEGAGIYEAGKTIVDWFKEDILGDKPAIHPNLMKTPRAVSTLGGIGAQATPTYDSTMDMPTGAGSW
tara:strand:- start:4248 stop:5288 length:1041 start_codon:yes stop_codon:yes gene_type:complete